MTKTAKLTEELFQKLGHITYGTGTCVYNRDYCASICDIVEDIRSLKKEKNALILAHSYITPDIIASVADFTGDSFELSRLAKETEADVIVFVAVRFMAETAKILNPTKTVLIPGTNPACSLADSITAQDVCDLKKQYPDYSFVCYINTTAAVKAHCDVCVTSSNVYSIVKNIPNDKIYFLPDRLMAENILTYLEKNKINKTLRFSSGTCYVHEKYDPALIDEVRINQPEADILAHPECNAGVVNEADFCGSTSQMINYVKESDAKFFYLLTECGLASKLQMELPNKKFIGSCSMCKYMKSNTLESIRDALKTQSDTYQIHLDSKTITDAKRCLDAMFRYA